MKAQLRPGERDLHLELQLRPSAKLISVMRRLVSDLLHDLLRDSDDAWRVALATHELVENAARHSLDGEISVTIDVLGDGERHLLTVKTQNRASAEQRETLEMHLKELEAASGADEHYLSVMRRTARRESGLGLARVWAEAEMAVTGAFEGDEVCILASTPVVVRRAGA
jgi:anti-sigma regulatory factor (Ser/Thr protein kinase)